MNLERLTRSLPFEFRIIGDSTTEIKRLCTDSRKDCADALFFCINGLHMDAHQLAPEVVQKGAASLVVERKLELDVPQIVVPNVRQAMSYIASEFYDCPAKELKMIGITGTKGKTTTSFMLRNILNAAGYKTGLIGTVCVLIADKELEAGKTTPDPVEFYAILRQMANAGVEYVIMEVSAHALDMHRIDGIRFATGGFTNFSQDHLDYFGTMDKYLDAKLKIIPMMDGKLAVNADDERVFQAVSAKTNHYSKLAIREKADTYANGIEVDEGGMSFSLNFHNRTSEKIHLRMSGIFNVYNALMASAMADELGIDIEYIKKGLESLTNVPGRVELLDTHTPYRVILDYAHSPDALENVLKSLRQSTKQRLIAVFGCGGGRDKLKRPIMGEIGGKLADFCVITSDNPRDEEPMSIIDSIEDGIKKVTDRYIVIENRREAIRYAMQHAQAGDTVVLAGKGHETYQEIKGVKHHFDEKQIVKELLAEI